MKVNYDNKFYGICKYKKRELSFPLSSRLPNIETLIFPFTFLKLEDALLLFYYFINTIDLVIILVFIAFASSVTSSL